MTGVGVVLGLGGTLIVSRTFETLLFGVGGGDLVTFIGSALLLGVAGLLAAWLPARRASRVDPMAMLRAE